MHEPKHVAAGLGHGGHLGEDRQVVDDKRHLAPLLPRQRLSVPQDSEPRDVGGGVGVEGVHQARRWKVGAAFRTEQTRAQPLEEIIDRYLRLFQPIL